MFTLIISIILKFYFWDIKKNKNIEILFLLGYLKKIKN